MQCNSKISLIIYLTERSIQPVSDFYIIPTYNWLSTCVTFRFNNRTLLKLIKTTRLRINDVCFIMKLNVENFSTYEAVLHLKCGNLTLTIPNSLQDNAVIRFAVMRFRISTLEFSLSLSLFEQIVFRQMKVLQLCTDNRFNYLSRSSPRCKLQCNLNAHIPEWNGKIVCELLPAHSTYANV